MTIRVTVDTANTSGETSRKVKTYVKLRLAEAALYREWKRARNARFDHMRSLTGGELSRGERLTPNVEGLLP